MIKMWKQCDPYVQSAFLLVVRLYWGVQFAMAGWGKATNIEKPIGYFATLGIPFHQLSAYLVTGVELVGGILLVLGLCARPAAALLALTMLGAYYFADPTALTSFFSNPSAFIAAAPFSFLFAALVIKVFGAGRYALDTILCKNKDKKPASST